MTPQELFDQMTVEGLQAILDGEIAAESVPDEGGRWGLSVVFRPRGRLRDQLADLTAEAAGAVGEHHWRTGSHGAAHVTVRALEPHSKNPLSSKKLNRYAAALERSARGIGPIPFELHGLAVSAGALMACAEDSTGAGHELRQRLQIELGEDGWLENSYFAAGRDPIWYVTLINFTGPLLDDSRFIAWFESNHDRSLGQEAFSQVDICRWQFEGSRMMPKVVATVRLDHENA
jgi:hypothetical protein